MIFLGPEERQEKDAQENFEAGVDEGWQALKEHGVVPEIEMGVEVVAFAEEKGAVGEEAGVGVHAEGDKGNAYGQGERVVRFRGFDGINTRDLLVALLRRAVGPFGNDHLSIGEEIHADVATAKGKLRAARNWDPNQDTEGSVMCG